MIDDFQSGLPDAGAPALEPAGRPDLDAIISSSQDVAEERATDRAAGKPVDADTPSVLDRARDEAGKFTRQKAPSKEPAPTAAPATTQAASPTAAPTALQAPPRWSDADKAAFTNLPPGAQKAVLDRNQAMEADYTRKTQEVAEQRKSVEPFLQALGPHTQYLDQVSRQHGQPPAQLIGSLIAVERTLRTGSPEQIASTLADLIRDYRPNLDLVNRYLGQAPQAARAPDPIINDIRQQLSELAADRQHRELREAHSQIEAFQNAKDEQGQPKYPHFEAVRALMVPHVERGLSFEDAYQVAAKPIADALAARDTATRTASDASNRDRAAIVARARQASSPRSSGSAPNGAAKKDLDAIISANMEANGIR